MIRQSYMQKDKTVIYVYAKGVLNCCPEAALVRGKRRCGNQDMYVYSGSRLIMRQSDKTVTYV